MRTATPLVTWGRITLCGPSATSLSISTPRFIGPGCRMSRSRGARSSRSRVTPKTRLYSRSDGMKPAFIRSSWSRSTLSASAHSIASSMRGEDRARRAPRSRWAAASAGRRPPPRRRAWCSPQMLRARHAAVQHVAADADALSPSSSPKLVAQREHVEQPLGRMLVLAVAGVDDVGLDALGRGTAPRPTRRGGSPPCRSASPRGSAPCPPASRPC